MKMAYLGPEGTFTEQAARYYDEGYELIPSNTIHDVLMAVESGEVDLGVVPIENSIEGPVNITIDTLIFDTNLNIKKQVRMPIKQNLMVNKNNKNKKIEKILSHPQGLAQCRSYVLENYKNAKTLEVSSTAEAGRIVSESGEDIAAICPELCAEIYDLDILAVSIQDNDNNKTDFILVEKGSVSSPKIDFKTSLVFSTFNKPGELYKILDIFNLWDINLTRISSRPTKEKAGEYVFFVDIEGFKDEKDAADALTMVRRKSNFFKMLGSYKVDVLL